MLQLILLLAALAGSAAGSLRYRGVAAARGIVAHLNTRTLHQKVVPRGGGVAFAAVFSLCTVAAWALGVLPLPVMLCFGVGGAAAAAAGFVDDVHDVAAAKKLAVQTALAAWMLLTFTRPLYLPLTGGSVLLDGLLAVALLFVPVWMINLYNFIDGIDGMAVGGAVYICLAALVTLSLTQKDPVLMFVLALLGAAGLGFACVNLPPASVFMGDAGSIFLGYCVSALALATVLTGRLSAWTWLCILAYYIGDTTTTTLSRMVLVERWYGGHRSHAYQNLARIWSSHARVTYGVLAFDLAWALPLAVWSALSPQWGPLAAALALAPPVAWALRFGPRFSSD